MKKLAHISDLHIGSRGSTVRNRLVVEKLLEVGPDLIVATGDITDTGGQSQLDIFRDIYAPVIDRLVVVPGNHDAMGDDVRVNFMSERLEVVQDESVFVVKLDSTTPHNRFYINSHGEISGEEIDEARRLFDDAGSGRLRILALHHHLLPTPGDYRIEDFISWFGLPFCREIISGHKLLDAMMGSCDLILHGHRHRPVEMFFENGISPLRLHNSGATPILGGFRVFEHEAGSLVDNPQWVHFGASGRGRSRHPAATRVIPQGV